MATAAKPKPSAPSDAFAAASRDPRALIDATRQGLGVKSIDDLIVSGQMTLAELDATVLPRKTLSHRRKLGVLTAEQSDRLVRVIRVIALAEQTFGSREKAAIWLRRASAALDGDSPLSLLDTGEGIRLVETLLARIDHGLAA